MKSDKNPCICKRFRSDQASFNSSPSTSSSWLPQLRVLQSLQDMKMWSELQSRHRNHEIEPCSVRVFVEHCTSCLAGNGKKCFPSKCKRCIYKFWPHSWHTFPLATVKQNSISYSVLIWEQPVYCILIANHKLYGFLRTSVSHTSGLTTLIIPVKACQTEPAQQGILQTNPAHTQFLPSAFVCLPALDNPPVPIWLVQMFRTLVQRCTSNV